MMILKIFLISDVFNVTSSMSRAASQPAIQPINIRIKIDRSTLRGGFRRDHRRDDLS